MSTPNAGIPYIPEDTLDPAAGLNLALNVIDALLQTAVIDMDQTAPPVTPADGDLHIVAASATGAWAGQDNNLARYVAEGAFWQFYAAGVNVHLILNAADGGLYAWNGSAWVAPIAAGSVAADAVSYDNTASGLAATEVQAAIDELAAATGGVASVNGESGVVVLTEGDIVAGINAQAGTTYTTILADEVVTMDNAAANTLTIPPNSAVAYPVGRVIEVWQAGAGQTTIAAGAGVTVTPGSTSTLKIKGQGDACSVRQFAIDEWRLIGDMEQV